MELGLSIVSLALLAGTAAAFAGRRPVLLSALGGVFVPAAGAATLAVWWPVSPALTVALLAVGVGVPIALLVLYVVDRVWAPFCLEMTYAMVLCWVLWRALVVVDLAGAAGRLLLRLIA